MNNTNNIIGLLDQELWLVPNVNIDEVKTFPLHYHKHIEFLYILEGETDMDIAGVTYTAKKGDVVLIAPYILHSYTCNGSCKRCIMVSAPEALGFFGDFLLNNHPSCPVVNADKVAELVPDIHELLRRAYELCLISPHCEPIKMTRIIAILYDILSKISTVLKFESSKDMSKGTYTAALKLCCDGFTQEDFGTEKIAEALSVSTSTIRKLFAKNMNMGVMEYINALRIGNAHYLLLNTTLPISEIALSSGFGTIRSFNRAFLRLRGCTPGSVRRKE